MLADIRIVIWKEWKLLKDQFGGEFRFGFVMAVILFVGLSTFAAYFAGALWVTSPVLLMTYPFISASIALTPVVDSFAGERERHTLETLLASRLSDSAILSRQSPSCSGTRDGLWFRPIRARGSHGERVPRGG